MAQGTALHIHVQYSDDEVIPGLKSLCDEALSFRLHYRLAQVSLISLHDMVYGAIAAALGLNALSDKIARDLTAVEQRLRRLRRPERALQRRVRILADEFEKGVCSFDPGGMLKTGATLVRQWRGHTHTVLVREEGFEYEGQRYRSLTVIAERITGAHWSGPRFFGLGKRARAS